MNPAFLTDVTRYEQPAGTIDRWHTFFGAEIPYLTDFLKGYDESKGPGFRDEILQDALAQQIAFIRNLHWESDFQWTVELRLQFNPDRRHVRLFFLCKAVGDDQETAERQAVHFWHHFNAVFPHHIFKIRPFRPDEAGQLRSILDFAADHVAEFRRYEHQEHLGMGETGYLVYPLQGSISSLTPLFRGLAMEQQPYWVSICLRPDELLPAEQQLLGVVASFCRELERKQEQGVTRTQEFVSISAGDAADIFTHYLHQLRNPFRLRLSVASTGPLQPGILAGLCADFSHSLEVEPGRLIPNKKGDFVTPQDQQQQQLAWANIRYLEFFDWMPRVATPTYRELDRLRFLVGAEAASSVFRIPFPPIGGLPGIDSQPPSLYEPLPEKMRYPDPAVETLQLGAVHLPLRTFTQHVLVAGTIGSGKTNTCVQLLHHLWADQQVPFLVIEPVNAEHNDYRSLGRRFPVPDELRIFTLGDEATSPLRFNPFDVPEGVILNTHISGVMACFQAALPMGDGPLPALFREAVRNIYFAKGWMEDERGGERVNQQIPSLYDLRDELDWLIRDRYGSRGETVQTLVGASVTRVNALINSSAGRILLAEKSIPLAELFNKPTILELRHLGSEEDKALMTGFILLALQEYCDRDPRREVGSGRLYHIVMLEEAHNLMEETGHSDPANGGAKAAAVKFFTNMLAENRKYGQGFFMAEQIPTLLAEGAIKNTVTKIMHRLPGPDDIELMGATMNFTSRHDVRAVALRASAGEAFLFTDGLNEATLVNIPYFKKDDLLSDDEVRQQMEGFRRRFPAVFPESLPFGEKCLLCQARCRYRPEVARLAYDRRLGGQVMAAYQAIDVKELDRSLARFMAPIRQAVAGLGLEEADLKGAAYCVFLHLQAQHKRLENLSAKVIERRL